MYKNPNLSIYSGRVDSKESNLEKRWHQEIKALTFPYEKKAGVAFIGFNSDKGVARNRGRVGAKEGALTLKKALSNFALHQDVALYDAGDIFDDNENLDETLLQLSNYVEKLLDKGHFPIVLGGGHDVAYGTFCAVDNFLQKKHNIAIINFDAHFDLRTQPEKSSGTPFLDIANEVKNNNKNFNYFCLGISKASNTKALFKQAKNLNVEYILDDDMLLLNIEKICNKLESFLEKSDYIYISIDSDGFFGWSVPSVSAPAARGIDPILVTLILKRVFKKYKNKIKAVDIAEFSPQFDINNIGQKVIARLIYDIVDYINLEVDFE